MDTECRSIYSSSHEQRPAAVVVRFPNGSQDPCCMECAQLCIRKVHGSHLAPLSSYEDPWETAQQQAAVDQALAEFGAACMKIPEDSLRRIANGMPEILDLKLLDQEMPEASLALVTGGTSAAERAEALTAAKKAGAPSPVQDIAWMAVRERGLSHRAPADIPPPRPPGPGYRPLQPRQPMSRTARKLWVAGISLASLALGIFLVSFEPDTAPGAVTPIAWGIFLILLGLAVAAGAVAWSFGKSVAGVHRTWLDSKPPSQQAPIVQAEKAALWAATATAAVGLHEHNKRIRQEGRS
jgi:hypothetical protein